MADLYPKPKLYAIDKEKLELVKQILKDKKEADLFAALGMLEICLVPLEEEGPRKPTAHNHASNEYRADCPLCCWGPINKLQVDADCADLYQKQLEEARDQLDTYRTALEKIANPVTATDYVLALKQITHMQSTARQALADVTPLNEK